MSAEKIAFILGGGALASSAISYCHRAGYDIYIMALQGNADPITIERHKDAIKDVMWCRPEQAHAILTFLKQNTIDKTVMIGSLKRPSFFALRPDFTALKIICSNFYHLLFGGDDNALNILRKEIEQKSGTQLVGLHEIWAEICAPHALKIGGSLDTIEIDMMKQGWHAAKAHGKVDKGQSVCIFPDGRIYKETKKGTDALIKYAAMMQEKTDRTVAQKGMLVKTSKPQQDLSLDMPTIGTQTIENLYHYGYGAVIIEAHKTIIHDKKDVFSLCEKYNIKLLSFTDEEVRAL